jgi:hypothetical protein
MIGDMRFTPWKMENCVERFRLILINNKGNKEKCKQMISPPTKTFTCLISYILYGYIQYKNLELHTKTWLVQKVNIKFDKY